MQKDSLVKLIGYISELSQLEGNEWFLKELTLKLVSLNSDESDNTTLNEIYEYCLCKIIYDHASKFYQDFKISEIKERLVDDFVRMEKFRRDDNFEDFCLATYQQLELIVNTLSSDGLFAKYYSENWDLPAILRFDSATQLFVPKGNQTVGKLIFQTSDLTLVREIVNKPVSTWFFAHKLRAVLYYYHFNKEIKYNQDNFDRIYKIGNYLYQGRNLNHRGSVQSNRQQEAIDELLPNQHKYYFKFMGFLEDFVTTINQNI